MKRIFGALLGSAAAALPALALAQEGERALETPTDATGVAVVTVLGILGLFLLAGLGYLYRRERGLDWDFQRPDTPHHDDHH